MGNIYRFDMDPNDQPGNPQQPFPPRGLAPVRGIFHLALILVIAIGCSFTGPFEAWWPRALAAQLIAAGLSALALRDADRRFLKRWRGQRGARTGIQ